jgi:aspartyl-tRNA synthetase
LILKEPFVALPYHERTHYCGDLRAKEVGQTVLLAGWVDVRRDLGGMVFIDLRDRTGIAQLKFNPESDPKAHAAAGDLRNEDCVAIRGTVIARGTGHVNKNLPTGEVEIEAHEIDVLSKSQTPPFEIADDIQTNEDLRLKYRVLDLRRKPIQSKMIARHRITKIIRDYFDKQGFVEIETPHLTKSTPEGARDYLVPSRLQHGMFYALPQSPQLFKQLLMMAGFDRYIQIARCFRDEDLRADRQPEFTQVDLEMAFAQPETVMTVVEGCIAQLWQDMLGVEITLPIPRMAYDDAMRDYGIDRPDLRYDIRIRDVTDIARGTEFKIFTQALDAGGVVRCITLPGGGDMTRKELDALTEEVKGIGAGGLPYVKVIEEGGKPSLSTGVAKFFAGDAADKLIAAAGAKVGDLILAAAGSEANVCKWLAWLRCELAERRGLIPENKWSFCWVVDFPAFGWDAGARVVYPMHHPFTSPRDEDLGLLNVGQPERPSDANILKARAKAYDLVLNGYELGGGSIRIHRGDVQARIFDLLGISEEEAKIKFEFLMDALKFGPPPHGGIALGLDRIVMLLTGTSNIRDVIAFPKNARAVCPLTNAPGPVDATQLKELGLNVP